MTKPTGKPKGRPRKVAAQNAGVMRARPIPGGHKARRLRAQENPGRGGEATGEGYGGPAHGLYRPFTSDTVPTGAAMSAGRTRAKNAREAARHYAVEAVDLWRDVVRGVVEPNMARVIAADKLIERAEGKPEQLTTHRIATPVPFDADSLPDEHREALRDILLLTSQSSEAE
jgi:hypothetical protein